MTREVNALVTAVGGIIGQGIMKCLKLANKKSELLHYKILASDASPNAAGLYRGDGGFITPPASSPEHVGSIIKVCREQQVDAIFVGADEELMPLALAKQRVEDESGAVVISNPPEVISLATDKWKTYEFLRKNKFPCAESALPRDAESFVKEFGFPIVVKPREGHGSEGFHVAQGADEIQY